MMIRFIKNAILMGCGICCVEAEELPETVISASRMVEVLKDSPYSVALIGSDDLLGDAIRTLPEALRDVPGVLIQKTTHAQGSPFIRGFTGRQNLLLVDGVRINNSTFRSGPVQYWNTVDSNAIERIELVRGQGSVLYGSDAFGGTVNTHTRSSNFLDQDEGWFNQNTAFYRFDTNSESHVGRLETIFGEGGKWGVLLGISVKDFGDIRDAGFGRYNNTGYSELDFDFRLDYAVSDSATLTLATQYVDQDDISRFHSTLDNTGFVLDGNVITAGSNLARDLDQERSLTYLKISEEEGAGWIKKWSAVLSYQTSQDSQFRDRSDPSDLTDIDLSNTNIDLQTWGLAVNFESDLGPGAIIYGADYYHDRVDSTGSRTGNDPREERPIADNSEYDLFGLYAQYRWKPSQLPKLEATVGVRYTYAKADIGNVFDESLAQDVGAEQDWDNLVLSGRVLYRATDNLNVYAGISEGFRAPNLNDLTGNLDSRSGVSESGSLDVDPEEFITYEIGAHYESDKFGYSLAAYYTEIDSIIARVPASSATNAIVTTTNGQDGFIYGFEASGFYNLSSQWQIKAQASWQEGETETELFIGGPVEEEYVSRLAPLMGSVSMRWSHPNDRFWIEGRVSAAATADKLSNNDQGDTQRIPIGGTPSHVIGSLYAGWQATDDILLTAAVENLTDEVYRVHGSGQNEAGVNLILGAKFSF